MRALLFCTLLICASASAQIALWNKTQRAIVPQGLVGYWTLDVADCQNGKVWDSSGTATGAFTVAVPTQTNGVVGQGMFFNGTQYVDTTTSSNAWYNFKTGTVCLWCKERDTGGETIPWSASSTSGTSTEIFIEEDWRSGNKFWNICCRYNGTTEWQYTIYIPGGYASNNWVHIAIAQNGVAPTFFTNGVLSTMTGTTTTAPSYWLSNILYSANSKPANTISIGVLRRSTGLVSQYAGAVDDVRVYNYALSAAQIASIYKAGH